MFERFKRLSWDDPLDDETEYEEAPRKASFAPKKSPVTRNKQEKLQQVLNYLITRNGQPTTCDNIADQFGFSSANANILVNELLAKKTITRIGGKKSGQYRVNHSRVNTPKKSQQSIKRRTRQSSTAIRQKILDYLTKHQEDVISRTAIHRSTGISHTSIDRHLRKLRQEGLISYHVVSNEGAKYALTKPDGPNVEPSELNDRENMFAYIEDLALEFIGARYSVNLLEFLDYLAKNLKG